jgi:cell division initiation protein
MGNDIRVSPLDIQQKRFHVAFRGYDRTDVEMFLDLVRDELETLVREVTALREFRQTYDHRLAELTEREETVKNTMFMTQKLMEDQKENARKEAALIVKDAEVRGLHLLANAQDEKAKLEAQLQELKRQKHHFLQDLKKVIEMHRDRVSFEEAGGDTTEESTPQ